ncbi:MAG TPA: LuxR C-terminal-related transcriptional regulator [Roseiflexaceae bacterium]
MNSSALPITALADHARRVSHHPAAESVRLVPCSDNLPLSLNSFIGREHEVAELQRLLRDRRLLTLTGTAGVGKTRLALEAASGARDSFTDGVWLVELASLSDDELVPQAVAAALGIREQPGRPLGATLADALRHQHLLLIMDNCEHFMSACAALSASLLRACPQLRILATSREALRVSGETTWRVAPLAPHDAVRLFVDRVQLAMPDFVASDRDRLAVASVCRQLDGLPLALELAAARVPGLGLEQLARRVGDRFRLLVDGDRSALPRQQTLRALVDWGYALLAKPEQALLMRLSVFSDGWTMQAAEEICAGGELERESVLPLLLRLVDTSHVVVDEHAGRPRYRLLETLRQYGAEKLREAGEEATLRLRHLDWFARLAEQAENAMWGPQQRVWIERLTLEWNNVRSAMEWSEAASAWPEYADAAIDAGLRLGSALWHFWDLRGQPSEIRMRLLTLLNTGKHRPRVRAKALHAVAYLTFMQGNASEGSRLAADTLALGPELTDPFLRASASVGVALGMLRAGDIAGATQQCEEGLAYSRAAGDRRGMYYALYGLAEVARAQGEIKQAIALMEEAHALTREQADAWSIGFALSILGNLNLQAGDPARAEALQQESLALRHSIGDGVGIGRCLDGLGWAASVRGKAVRAARLWGAGDAIRRRVGAAPHLPWQAEHERHVTDVRTRLGDGAFDSAWAEGGMLDLEQAVAYALIVEASATPRLPAVSEPRTVDSLAGLSSREREVALLIAQGYTNRAIADELVISERTAEGHVERIRGKLGFQSRAQIAAWVVERRVVATRAA